MKWNDPHPDSNEGHHLGRRCTRCKDSGSSSSAQCSCTAGTGVTQCSGTECKCALAGKCCKCCCTNCKGKCKQEKDRECSCDKNSYRSAYTKTIKKYSYVEEVIQDELPTWKHLTDAPTGTTTDGTASQRRHQGAQILLGSVCLIWSGITYMYWTGKYHKSSPRWNNHILDGSGLDDGTLSQWLQALGFPRKMLNNHGPGNRWDAIIWDGLMGMLYLGFPETGNGGNAHGHDQNDNTFRNPAGMNYAGYLHTVDRGAFCSKATVFHKNGSTITEENIHKCGALYKLYILSCAYFTGLQNKAPPKADNKTPRTIREILYWLSALPYSPAYKGLLEHGKDKLQGVAPVVGDKKQLSFYQTGLKHPITVDEYNLFAHFQAVTQYCPLVLIGIQGGLKGTDKTLEPAIHALYANTECNFTYPGVPIQAYNQVVHYIRALFYQLYFLRKQCAVKVTCGGKWRECRYGDGVVSKGVISWMCLGCDPMEHDRKKRVGKVKGELRKVVSQGGSGNLPGALKDLLQKIGDVVVQLGNAQEALEGKEKKAIEGVKEELRKAKQALEGAKNGLDTKLGEAKKALEKLTTNGGGDSGALHTLANGGNTAGSLHQVATASKEYDKDYSSGKDRISAAINGILQALELIKGWAKGEIEKQKTAKENMKVVLRLEIPQEYTKLLNAINQLISICTSPKCSACAKHSDKCGQQPVPRQCPTCHQQYMDGTPSPLQAFLEDRLPGFSCQEILYTEDADKYPPAASHLGHCGGSGQCCPLPMGFRGNFQERVTNTGQHHHLDIL
ncbi:variant erythrocyte surface antigen-1 alpha subunit [Babesia bovis T2Bo]|uniref:Variant erythrocyte surface antigen-1, alpha subunit n=1 Tax=Babesia bovis TaxID=5865 RepID=A7AUY0_BABBO|nr:variant erythrocyte surface antigen-1 alpha subunit [Babesia bovis T2Bo]EDO05606.1 variant erythrocyte surface antigen-1 alpha subunit [Babesia bovis T2Bo]|eukprot:XP_001609174.1 variant erythrocyte surface antigen-1, alpha subunit [Babesia bovis T2Bo]